jgi:hypothetical protein
MGRDGTNQFCENHPGQYTQEQNKIEKVNVSLKTPPRYVVEDVFRHVYQRVDIHFMASNTIPKPTLERSMRGINGGTTALTGPVAAESTASAKKAVLAATL